ncbi:MAG: 3'(2'), 5'-bisphosphate nucleotidase [Planctomycetota bacterium]|jgi:3'(2'), 5'-bisphosphate nucleotidase
MQVVSEKMEQVITLVRQAGARARELRELGLEIDTKSHAMDFVTNADRELDTFLCEHLGLVENIPILSEEAEVPFTDYDTHRYWIVDPIDGTSQYAAGFPDYSVAVGQIEDGYPVFSVIYDPEQDALWFAEKGQGAYMIQGDEDVPQKIQVTKQEVMCEALLVKRATSVRRVPSDDWIESHHPSHLLLPKGAGILLGMMLAQGSCDAVFFFVPTCPRYDVPTMQCIVEEAGGLVTNIHGDRLWYGGTSDVVEEISVVSNGRVHDALIQYYRDCSQEAYAREI